MRSVNHVAFFERVFWGCSIRRRGVGGASYRVFQDGAVGSIHVRGLFEKERRERKTNIGSVFGKGPTRYGCS